MQRRRHVLETVHADVCSIVRHGAVDLHREDADAAEAGQVGRPIAVAARLDDDELCFVSCLAEERLCAVGLPEGELAATGCKAVNHWEEYRRFGRGVLVRFALACRPTRDLRSLG